jgi:hypothetical protein
MSQKAKVITFTTEAGILHMRAGSLESEEVGKLAPVRYQFVIRRSLGQQLIELRFLGDFDEAQDMAIIDYTMNGLARVLHKTYVSRYPQKPPLPVDYIRWQRVSQGHWITDPGKFRRS